MSNPERQLGIGYSIAFLGGKVLKSVKDVNIEDMVDIKMADGALKTKVNNIKYVYWLKGQRAFYGEGQLGITKIFENSSVDIFQVE